MRLPYFIELIETTQERDGMGFSNLAETVVAKARAYKENRHGSKAWQNRAAFSNANALFRFRRIPGIEVTTAMLIRCDGQRYNILYVDTVRNLYVEVMAEKVEPTKG